MRKKNYSENVEDEQIELPENNESEMIKLHTIKNEPEKEYTDTPKYANEIENKEDQIIKRINKKFNNEFNNINEMRDKIKELKAQSNWHSEYKKDLERRQQIANSKRNKLNQTIQKTEDQTFFDSKNQAIRYKSNTIIPFV